MGKRRPKPVSILTDAEWRPPLIETEGIAGKTIIMSNHNFYPNTELGIDLKLITRKPGRLGIGEYLDGAITHDGEDHIRAERLREEEGKGGAEKSARV